MHDQTSISHCSNLEKHQQKEILKNSRSAVLNNANHQLENASETLDHGQKSPMLLAANSLCRRGTSADAKNSVRWGTRKLIMI